MNSPKDFPFHVNVDGISAAVKWDAAMWAIETFGHHASCFFMHDVPEHFGFRNESDASFFALKWL